MTTEDGVVFSYVSPDGEDGFSGRVHVSVSYTLGGDDTLYVEYLARSDRDTPINLTNHSYFDLSGGGGRNIEDHLLQLNSDAFLATDGELLPTGKVLRARGTAFDFTIPKRIGADITRDDEQLALGRGYDHCFLLKKDIPADSRGDALLAAVATDASRRHACLYHATSDTALHR